MFNEIVKESFMNELQKIAEKCRIYFSNPPVNNDLTKAGVTGSSSATEIFFSKSAPGINIDRVYH